MPVLLATSATAAPSHLTFVQAVVIGVFQGIAELFPVSSLGHDVLIPKLFGWNDLLRSEASAESFWLAFVVGLHVANAVALLVFFWRDWVRIVRGWCVSLVRRRITSSTERLAWLIVVSTIPVGVIGLLLEHQVRVLLAKPLSAAIFLMVNGGILIVGQRARRRDGPAAAADPAPSPGGDDGGDDRRQRDRLATMSWRDAGTIGVAQSLALIAGISRDGVCMVAGLVRGLDNEDAAKFAFLLSTPVILAAGLLKFGDLTGPLGRGVHGQIIAGAVVTLVVSLVAVRFLSRYFRTRNLRPFGLYCLGFGAFMTAFTLSGA